MKKWIRKLTRLELVLIYFVIIAGSVVRMTGSGMGCPDWPKCFGHLIPPTERDQIEWHPNQEFKKGQIIIVDESLQVAREDFTSSTTFAPENWEKYTKHDYAIFNAFHTWTEYINRLFGAVSGIPMLLLVILGGLFVRTDWRYFVLSLCGLFMLGFEAWLGKLVVDGNLIPGSITIHMMGALLIVAILLVQLALSNRENLPKMSFTPLFKNLFILSIILTLVQIVIGTQVREQVDHLNEAGVIRNNWVENLDWQFYVHRSFSVIVLALNFWLWRFNKKYQLGFNELNAVMILIGFEVLLGVLLNYVDFPKFAQPSHLLLGTILLAFQLYAIIRFTLGEKSQALLSRR